MTQKALTSLLIPCGATVVALALGACQTNPTAMNAPPGMPIALESIEGAPDAVKSELSTALATAAVARKVELVSGTDARYRLKGYLTAYDRQDGSTELAFVWDVFDGDKRRAKRIEGTSFSVAGAGGAAQAKDAATGDTKTNDTRTSTAWTAVDQTIIDKVASTSMSEVAGFLATDARFGGQTAVAQADAAELPAAPAFGTQVASASEAVQASVGQDSTGQSSAGTAALGFAE
ncbi:hypothetical protein [Chelatococcus asaccharovorans]|uniref:Lipoprotein n=1 Tax=Chelatococcus asaccharovorans TaxID=28210 RepID=A0A2V3U0H9_9HYPH|nr:hypothetical protein [Chelatococcus asaccharovorans]MBS7704427.1 hypothetical protein [Chelatococcus asaccharovorans]PXW55693.1 hypothetical protein C7450_109101 [Chelatococcus asaccharovorans]